MLHVVEASGKTSQLRCDLRIAQGELTMHMPEPECALKRAGTAVGCLTEFCRTSRLAGDSWRWLRKSVVPATVDWKVDWTRQVAGGQVAPLPDFGDHWQGEQSVTVGEVFVPWLSHN